MLIHLAGEHTPELQFLDLTIGFLDFFGDICKRVGVLFFLCQGVEFLRLVQRTVNFVQSADNGLERCPFSAECLRTIRLAPDVRALQLSVDFL
jgi:hypothetical protein